MVDGKALAFPLKKIRPKEVAELLEVAYKPLDDGSYGADTIIHYSSDPKYSCAIATLKIGDEVVGAKLTLPKDAEPIL